MNQRLQGCAVCCFTLSVTTGQVRRKEKVEGRCYLPPFYPPPRRLNMLTNCIQFNCDSSHVEFIMKCLKWGKRWVLICKSVTQSVNLGNVSVLTLNFESQESKILQRQFCLPSRAARHVRRSHEWPRLCLFFPSSPLFNFTSSLKHNSQLFQSTRRTSPWG